jgi:hypothetical protein
MTKKNLKQLLRYLRINSIIIIVVSYTFFTFYFSENTLATVSGDCDACHKLFPGLLDETLHGELVSTNVLCINCHSSDGKDTVKIIGRSRVPVVFNEVKPENPLAGGNFFYVAEFSGDRKGHNVDGIASMDSKFKGAPPGYYRDFDPSIPGYNTEKPLNCAGSNGCHGNRNIKNPYDAIKGAHHAVDKPVDGTTTARSYRFLKNTDEIKGVVGFEDADWGRNSTSDKHNEYSPSIDVLCASCHGKFHLRDKDGKKSPWFRHPVGIVLPETGEYARYNPDISPPDGMPGVRIYNPDAPVGRQKVLKAPGEEVKLGEDMVICISCHIAHSSPYESILRWDYDNIYAHEESKGGCLICHTGK